MCACDRIPHRMTPLDFPKSHTIFLKSSILVLEVPSYILLVMKGEFPLFIYPSQKHPKIDTSQVISDLQISRSCYKSQVVVTLIARISMPLCLKYNLVSRAQQSTKLYRSHKIEFDRQNLVTSMA